MNADRLLTHYEKIADAPDAILRLRRFILDLAVRGKLVEQDPNDEPASELLKRIAAEKARLVEMGVIRKPKVPVLLSHDELPFPLPKAWAWTQIAELGVISPRNDSRDDHIVSFVSMRMIPAEYGATNVHEPRLWGEIKRGYTHFAEGDVGLAKITPCFENGKSIVFRNLTGGIGGGTTELHVVRPICVNADYIVLFLKTPHFIETGIPRMTGTAGQKRVPAKYFANSPFPLPPLAEQHRIVTKVDELMVLCDQLEAARAEREETRDRLVAASFACLNVPHPDPAVFQKHARFALKNFVPLTTRPDQIKAFRQTILNLVVRGKLVPQDPNDEPAAELLKRVAAEKGRLVKDRKSTTKSPLSMDEIPFSLPFGWHWSRIGELCTKTGSGSTPRGGKEVYRKVGIPFLRSQNVYDDGLRLEDVAYIGPSVHLRMAGTAVQSRDLLLNITGGSLGRCCRVPDEFGEANVSQHVAIIRLAVSEMADFLHRLVLSPYFQAFIFDEQTGAGRGGLPKYKMDRIPVAVPPLPEQCRIVAKVDELMALCDQIEASLATGDNTRRRLLDALLHEALVSSEEESQRYNPHDHSISAGHTARVTQSVDRAVTDQYVT